MDSFANFFSPWPLPIFLQHGKKENIITLQSRPPLFPPCLNCELEIQRQHSFVGSSIHQSKANNQPRAGLDWVSRVLVINASTNLPSEQREGVSHTGSKPTPSPGGGQLPTTEPTTVQFLAFCVWVKTISLFCVGAKYNIPHTLELPKNEFLEHC